MTVGSDFDGFYREMHPRLWAFLVRTTRQADLADEVTQEAFVRLLASRAASWPLEQRRAYLFRIARNLVHDAGRRRARERQAAVKPDAKFAAAAPSEPMGQRAAAVLAGLSERERQLLWLAHVEGWTHVEIARLLGLAAGSIRVLLHRARRRFRAGLGEEGSR